MSATFAALVVSALPTVPPPRSQSRDIDARFVLETTVTTLSARAGDRVPLIVADGFVIDGIAIARGSRARGVVVNAVRPGRIRGRGSLAIDIVSVTRLDGTPLPVSGTCFIEPPRRRGTPPDPQVPILAGMAVGYGTAALVSTSSTSSETIGRAGLVAGVTTAALVGILKRGEDFGLLRGAWIDVTLARTAPPR